jgi:16S rRNA (guanine527-N7)-methyltransferase
VNFEDELAHILPADLPHRDVVITKGARHLELIVEANESFNLTRITTPHEAAIKHVLDSVLPWALFAGAKEVLDAGSGAGYPGIPLALILTETQFTLSESIQKKARFLDAALECLELTNVKALALRAEDILKTRRFDVITARAMAPISRALGYFTPAMRVGSRCLLYKGPDAETEIEDAAPEARKRRIALRVIARYDLPESLGTRTIVEMQRESE